MGSVEELRERDKRINAWLGGVKPGDIVMVRLNSTDILSGKVYEAPDDSDRTALYVNRTLLRYGNGLPGSSFEPVLNDDEPKERELTFVEAWHEALNKICPVCKVFPGFYCEEGGKQTLHARRIWEDWDVETPRTN